MSDYQYINVAPRPSGFGVEITGLDLTSALDSEQVAEIKQAWHAHGVAFFPEQAMTPVEKLVARAKDPERSAQSEQVETTTSGPIGRGHAGTERGH